MTVATLRTNHIQLPLPSGHRRLSEALVTSATTFTQQYAIELPVTPAGASIPYPPDAIIGWPTEAVVTALLISPPRANREPLFLGSSAGGALAINKSLPSLFPLEPNMTAPDYVLSTDSNDLVVDIVYLV